ncbi:MAG: penicillin-binding transpeptidase domain-containing protein [Thomasclavelia ramosa]
MKTVIKSIKKIQRICFTGRNLGTKDAVDGDDIYLTIDSSLQRDLDYQLATEAAAAQALKASCVIMEAKTGKILALSSYPSFNPNERNIEDYKNFFFDTAYECGSVFKSFVYASSIESGLYNGAATYESGKYDYGGSRPIATIIMVLDGEY